MTRVFGGTIDFNIWRGSVLVWTALLLCSFVLPNTAHAQGEQPKRLSDWLLEQPASADSYPLGLSWRLREEIPPQHAMLQELINRLSGIDREVKASNEATGRLREWLRTMPATGRVRVVLADARWLQANPTRDPVILPGQSVVLPVRPRSVTVVTDGGERCAVPHAAGREAKFYLLACNAAADGQIDWAWVAQPDGTVQRIGVANWNEETQDEPAPGAWIWGPRRGSGWPEGFSERLIQFLATQGPAADPEVGKSVDIPSADVRWTLRAPDTDGGKDDSNSYQNYRRRNLELTASNWGSVGLLQTPTARMRGVGEFSLSFSHTYPYTLGNVFMQPFEWLETGFRYTDISNVLYGPVSLSGNQSYKDKSVDFKIRLMTESAYVPQVSVGIRDVTGTGLFAGEYLVGSKRTGSFDWSLGLGWGYLGARGDIRNPLGRLRESFDAREATVGTGKFAFASYFRGPTALFGGVQYQTPMEKLVLKLEYDGNNYKHEPFGNNPVQRSAFNIGAVYRLYKSVDLNFGVERGNTLMLGFAVHTQLDQMSVPKQGDPRRIGVFEERPLGSPDWAVTYRDISTQTDWHVSSIEQAGRDLRVTVNDADMVYWRERLDRVVSVLHRDAPASVDRFVIAYRQNGLGMAEHVVDRDTWVAQRTRPVAPRDWREDVIARAAIDQDARSPFLQKQLPRFESGMRLNYQQNLGGPDGFVLYQIGVVETAKLRLRDDTWVHGRVQLGLLDNYGKFKYTAPSNLQRVRTYLREYVTTSPLTVPIFQATHVGRLGQNQYYSVYGGLLESMFAGVGAEWLYRPMSSRVALGVDVNAVQQRGFRQDFELRDYKVATGHGTLYWDTGWNDLEAKLSAGRYLAKDVGVTVDLSRVFKNGVRVGAWFTRSNLSAEQFGEGSFDKGIYLSIPFDAFLTRSSNTIANFIWQPLTRDGGAKLYRDVQLYGLTQVRSDRTLEYRQAPPLNEEVIPSDRRNSWAPKETGPEPYTRVLAKPSAQQWAAAPRYAERLHDALYAQYYRDIRVEFDASFRLIVNVASERISPASLAVGRAARTALQHAPLETREIRIVFAGKSAPLATYDFVDISKLANFFQGTINQSELAAYVVVDYLDPAVREKYPLTRLDDLEPYPERGLADVLLPDTRNVNRVVGDIAGAGKLAVEIDWWRLGAMGTGMVMASSVLDKGADRYATNHAAAGWLKAGVKIGNALPVLAIGAAGLAALNSSDPVLSRTGYAATEAGGVAFLAVTGLKYVFGRARPTQDLGNRDFKFLSSAGGHDSFPSGHTIISWAIATPFAEEYRAPWLYGVAAVTNLARIGSRQHWLSDTVAGSLLGYGIGQFFYQSSREVKKGEPRVMVAPQGVSMAWQW